MLEVPQRVGVEVAALLKVEQAAQTCNEVRHTKLPVVNGVVGVGGTSAPSCECHAMRPWKSTRWGRSGAPCLGA